ncbi:MAG: C40 family peptidase [Alphaproteobacteria bacterium]|nr:C40 family peptidase [Alphaproteobacteria bacterium]
MVNLFDALPEVFRQVRYDGSRIPDGTHDLSAGANCQRYAYAVLSHFGVNVPPFRSSELWADHQSSAVVTRFEPLDLLLFSRDGAAYGAHVAVYVGEGQALHLAKSVGTPAIWSLHRFPELPAYQLLLGGKRARRD